MKEGSSLDLTMCTRLQFYSLHRKVFMLFNADFKSYTEYGGDLTCLVEQSLKATAIEAVVWINYVIYVENKYFQNN